MDLNESELTAWGRRVGAEVGTPVVFALRGDLGAGKSVLARAIAGGAGVQSAMPSPTFNLLYRYSATRGSDTEPVEIWHLDLYRLEEPDEVWELGWDEIGEGRQIVLIEWPERAEDLLPPDRWDIFLEITGTDERTLRIVRQGVAPALPQPDPAGLE